MMDFKVEYMSVVTPSTDPTTNVYVKVPVVRLAEVEKLIQEAEWAVYEVISAQTIDGWPQDTAVNRRAQDFLANLAAWRKGQRNCPTCDSPQPHLHPAIQHGGEVQPCTDPWHGRKG